MFISGSASSLSCYGLHIFFSGIMRKFVMPLTVGLECFSTLLLPWWLERCIATSEYKIGTSWLAVPVYCT